MKKQGLNKQAAPAAQAAPADQAAAPVACNVFGSFNITFFQSSFDSGNKLLGVDFSQTQVNDTLDTESKTDNQCDGNQTHERCSTFNKFSLDFFVNTAFFS